MPKGIKLSVVVPVYNEEKIIGKFLNELRKVMRGLKMNSELIVVDDGSKDGTFDAIKRIREIKLIRHSCNKGYGSTLKTGIRASRGEYVLFIDGDGQYKPEEIKEFVKYLGKYDVISAARIEQASFLRAMAKRIISWFANYITETKIPDINAGLRVTKRDILMRYINLLPTRFSATATLTVACLRAGYEIKFIPVTTLKRVGKSKIKPMRDFTNFLLIIAKTALLFSPLKIFLPISVLFFVSGLVYLLYSFLLFASIPASSIFLLTTGILVFCIGLISEQINSLRFQRE